MEELSTVDELVDEREDSEDDVDVISELDDEDTEVEDKDVLSLVVENKLDEGAVPAVVRRVCMLFS